MPRQHGPAATICELSEVTPEESSTCEVWLPQGSDATLLVRNDRWAGQVGECFSLRSTASGVPMYLVPTDEPQEEFVVVLHGEEAGQFDLQIGEATRCSLRVVPPLPYPRCALTLFASADRYAYPDQWPQCLEQLGKHGCTSFMLYGKGGERDDGQRRAAEIDALIEADILKPDVPAVAFGEPWELDIARRYSRYPERWPTWMLYTHDEPNEHDEEEVADKAKTIRGAGYGTASCFAGYMLPFMAEYHDIAICQIGQFNSINQQTMHDREQPGECWAWTTFLRGTNAPLHRYLWGLWAWATGVDGVVLWAYTNIATSRVCEDGRWECGENHEHVLATPNGPLSTCGLEGLRDGAADYMALQAIEHLCVYEGRRCWQSAYGTSRWLQALRDSVSIFFWPRLVEPAQPPWPESDHARPPVVSLAAIRKEALWLIQEWDHLA